MNRRHLIDGGWLLFFGIASSIWCLTAAAHLGATFDEPIYLRCGLDHWHTGSYKQLMRLGAMPLAIDLQTLPVYLWEKWRGNPVAFDDALRWARAATLVFWWILLIYTWRAGRTIAGNWGGRIAVALLACEPVLLGHSALATSDIAVVACLLVLVVEFRAGRGGAWPRRLLLPAILYGVAILAKASALMFGPLFLLTVEAERLWYVPDRRPISREIIRNSLLDLLIIGVGGLGFTFLYCGSDWTTERTFIEWAQTLPPGNFTMSCGGQPTICGFSRMPARALLNKSNITFGGHGTFILGHEYPRAIWFYFRRAHNKTTPLSALSLPLVILAAHRTALRNWAFVIAAVLLVYSLTCRVQIGIRFMFPLMVFLCIGLGAAAAVALGHLRGWRQIALTIWLGIGISAAAFSGDSRLAARDCYTNLAWGGTKSGYRLLSDSKYDWGQGLPDLRTWQGQHDVAELNVWYFGTDPSVHLPPVKELPLHRPETGNVGDAVKDKIVAVSTTLLYGSYTSRPPASDAVAFFRSRQPFDRTMTFLIYDFRGSSSAKANP